MLTPEQEKFVADIHSIYLKNKQIQSLADARARDEQALVIKYGINACNAERATIANTYQPQIQTLRDEIKVIQDQIT